MRDNIFPNSAKCMVEGKIAEAELEQILQANKAAVKLEALS